MPFEDEQEKLKFVESLHLDENDEIPVHKLKTREPIHLNYPSTTNRISTQLVVKPLSAEFFGVQDGSHRVSIELDTPLEEGHEPLHVIFHVNGSFFIDIPATPYDCRLFYFNPPALKKQTKFFQILEFKLYLSNEQEFSKNSFSEPCTSLRNIHFDSQSDVMEINYLPSGKKQYKILFEYFIKFFNSEF